MNKKAFIFIVVFIWLGVQVQAASAHASLVHSEPFAGEVLGSSPQEIVLQFSEDLDGEFTSVQLFNSTGELVESGAGIIDPNDPRTLSLSINHLPNDSYTAVWQVRSAFDGHITNGNVPFGIGVAPADASLIPPLGTPDPALETPPPLESASALAQRPDHCFRIGEYFIRGPGLEAGSTRCGTNRKRLRRNRSSDDENHAAAHYQGLLAFDSSHAFFRHRAGVESGGCVPFLSDGRSVVEIVKQISGKLLLLRAALFLLIGLLVRRISMHRWMILFGLGGGVLLTFSLLSHAAAIGESAVPAIFMDWLHWAGMAAWVGGLLPLAFVVTIARRQPEIALPLSLLIPRFSLVAVSSVVILSISGLYSYLLHINRLDLLTATTYGRTLLVKTSLFAVLFVLGAVNLLILSPRLRAYGNQMAVPFSRTVRIEIVLGILLLVAVGVLTSVAPARIAWEAHERLFVGMVRQETVDDVVLTLRVAPFQIGDNEFAVDVVDHRPGAEAVNGEVILLFKRLDTETGVLQVETQSEEGQRFAANGNYLSAIGRWEIEVILRRTGFNDVRIKFELPLLKK